MKVKILPTHRSDARINMLVTVQHKEQCLVPLSHSISVIVTVSLSLPARFCA